MLVALRSRRHIAPFTAERPTSIAEAVARRGAPGRSAYMAGGSDLIDWMKQGHVLDRVIRLDGIAGLTKVTEREGALHIGACATHAGIATDGLIRQTLPDLATLWQGVANPRVRFTATIGGNVMARRSEYDGLPALLALGATADTADGPVPLDQLAGPETLVTGFTIPHPQQQRLFADRSLRPALAIWLGLTVEGARVSAIRMAVGMAHPAPVCAALPLDLAVAALGAEAGDLAAALLRLLPEPATDGRASAAYRRRMVGVLARRILIRAGGGA